MVVDQLFQQVLEPKSDQLCSQTMKFRKPRKRGLVVHQATQQFSDFVRRLPQEAASPGLHLQCP